MFLFSISTWAQTQNQLGHGYEFDGNGKDHQAERLYKLYTPSETPAVAVPVNGATLTALQAQSKWLSKRQDKSYSLEGVAFSNSDLKQAADLLQAHLAAGNKQLPPGISAYQIKGEDGLGNVHFTGYFTPIIRVRATPDATYKYPIYGFPADWEGPMPSREGIDGDQKALAGKGLELAWASSLLEIYYMHVQGSGYVEFEDGSRQMLHYGGKNGYSYKSIGKYLVTEGLIPAERISMQAITEWFEQNPELLKPVLFSNPSYTFFARGPKRPAGAISVPLEGGVSIAVDSKCIPLGACLLAAVPILDQYGNLLRHEYRVLVAQDRGAAIRGSGHVDLYQGIGLDGQRAASSMHHYGKIWLLLPNS